MIGATSRGLRITIQNLNNSLLYTLKYKRGPYKINQGGAARISDFYTILLIYNLARLIKSIPIYRVSRERAQKSSSQKYLRVREGRRYNYKYII